VEMLWDALDQTLERRLVLRSVGAHRFPWDLDWGWFCHETSMVIKTWDLNGIYGDLT
jgi:hypothetical protein